jgi:hypothetical protein
MVSCSNIKQYEIIVNISHTVEYIAELYGQREQQDCRR